MVNMVSYLPMYSYWSNKVEKIDSFFPAKDNETLLKFLSNDDGRFDARANAFTSYISGICDPTETSIRTFSDSLMDLLFQRNYIQSHKWVFNK